MAFAHEAGSTTPGAPDHVLDWFTRFQAFIVADGWTVVAGGGTKNMVISSPGELGAYTMLFVHIWESVANTVRIEVSDDVIPTHETNEAGTLVCAGVQFQYWMSADLDALVICWKSGAAYRVIYAGCVMPFAQAVPDETYISVVTSSHDTASVLRNTAGLWDRDIVCYGANDCDDMLPSPMTGSFPLMGHTADAGNVLVGQFRHLSGRINVPAVSVEDTITTVEPTGTTTWIVLRDQDNWRFGFRTGGVLPAGIADSPNYASATGVTISTFDFLQNVLVPLLTGIGWTDNGDPGHPWMTPGRQFFSTGESGLETNFISVGYRGAPTNGWVLIAHDDAAYTHETGLGVYFCSHPAGAFPTTYYVLGDLDCLVFAMDDGGARYRGCWLGLCVPFFPDVVGSPYKAVVYSHQAVGVGRVLRDQHGAWGQQCNFEEETWIGGNSNALALDPNTYLLWPCWLNDVDGADAIGVGSLKYLYYTNGGGIAQGDTIQVAGQTYTVLDRSLGVGQFYGIRTA